MSLTLAGRYSAHATAFTRTILSWPEQYLVKFLFQLYAEVTDSGWSLQCSCYGIYTHNTVPARITATSPPFSPVSILDFSTYVAASAWHPDTRDGRLQG